MSIIRKTAPRPGWQTTTQIPQRVLTCEICGALCDEATTNDHDAWHEVLERKSLPLLVDFLTAPIQAAAPVERPAEASMPEEPNSTKRHIQLPKLIAADELRRPNQSVNPSRTAGYDDVIADELDRADQIA